MLDIDGPLVGLSDSIFSCHPVPTPDIGDNRAPWWGQELTNMLNLLDNRLLHIRYILFFEQLFDFTREYLYRNTLFLFNDFIFFLMIITLNHNL